MENVEQLKGSESKVETQQEVKDFKKPIKVVRAGKITISIWENTASNGDKFNSCTIKKNYKDKNGEWKNVQNFNKNDLPEIAFACGNAYNEFD